MSLSIWKDNFVVEFSDSLLKLAVALRSRMIYMMPAYNEDHIQHAPPCNRGYGNPLLAMWAPHMELC